MRTFIAERRLEDRILLHGGVDQADCETVADLVDRGLATLPLDLVIDDASHDLEPSRATFNTLFPRLQPGGHYLLEDWAHRLGPLSRHHDHGEPPLVELVAEILRAKGRHPGLIGDVNVCAGGAIVTRGSEEPAKLFHVATY